MGIKKNQGESSAPRRARKVSSTAAAKAEPMMMVELEHDAVAARAYELYEAAGRPDGQDLQHWLAAEAEIRARVNAPRA